MNAPAQAQYSPTHAENFAAFGFVFVKNAIPSGVIADIDEKFVNESESWHEPGLRHASFNSNPALRQYRNAAHLFETYQVLMQAKSLLEPVTEILNGSVQILGTELLRRGQLNAAHEQWHRDAGDLLDRVPDRRNGPLQVKAQVWLTDTSKEMSGNLVVIPGSHLWSADQFPPLYWEEQDALLAQGHLHPSALVILAEPGDALVFANTIWHTVQPNHRHERRSAILRYGQRWMRPYDHTPDPAEAPTWMKAEARQLLGYYDSEPDGVRLYKDKG